MDNIRTSPKHYLSASGFSQSGSKTETEITSLEIHPLPKSFQLTERHDSDDNCHSPVEQLPTLGNGDHTNLPSKNKIIGFLMNLKGRGA
jgi:hypothetical protein